MPIKVTVVVPVYNPGSYIEDLIASLLRQSMPASDFEAIFVDDGSTDETPARLDRMAAEHAHLRVIHQENSGWPGKPRNVGIDNAKGEYVFFCDNDDWLGDEALERMYDFATANQADVLIPKMAGIGRGVPRELFRKTRPSATLESAPLIDSLTPHKLFRREFLDKHGLRFPEGRRRLEDHVFVTAAYFAAETISVLSDYVCYYHIRRDDVGNAGFQQIEPKGYFANLSEALDIVLANTQPGKLRDKVFRRWLRVEMVERLRGRRLLQHDPEYRRLLFDEIRSTVTTYFGPGVATGLAPAQRLVARLVTADRLDALEELAAWEARIRSVARLSGLRWNADGELEIDVSAQLAAGSDPVRFVHRNGRDLLETPLSEDMLSALSGKDLDCTKRLANSKIDVLVRHRVTKSEFFLPIEYTAVRQQASPASTSPANVGAAAGDGADGADGAFRKDGPFSLTWTGHARLDPERISGREPLTDGLWDVVVRVNCTGWVRDTVLHAPAADDAVTPVPAVVGSPARLVTPYRTDRYDNLAVDVGQTLRRLDARVLAPAPPSASVHLEPADDSHEGDLHTSRLEEGHLHAKLVLTIPLRTVLVAPATPVLRLTREPERVEASGVLTADSESSRTVLTCTVPREKLSHGRWTLQVRLAGPKSGQFLKLPLRLVVASDGTVALRPADQARTPRKDREPGQAKPKRLAPAPPPASHGLRGQLYRAARQLRRRLLQRTSR